jgi:hypothetical protein
LSLPVEAIYNGKKLFKRFDRDCSGYLDRREMFNLMNYFFSINGLAPASHRDIAYLFHKYDIDGDGEFSKREFKWMLKEIGGQKCYNVNTIRYKRKHKKKNKKYKKFKKMKFGGMKLKKLGKFF